MDWQPLALCRRGSAAWRQYRSGSQPRFRLAAKTALTSGCVARFVVGNPEIQSIDVLAGATVDRAGIAEQVAQQGEIVLDAASVQLTRTLLESVQWRTSNQSLAVVSVADQSAFLTSTAIDDERTDDVASLPGTSVASWLLPAVRQGFKDGQERYLGELRPAVALFVRFVGLDYDADMDALGASSMPISAGCSRSCSDMKAR